jgi:carbon storage regulator
MLVLSRKIGERILIGDGIAITVVRCGPGGVRLGIVAPPELAVMREELRLPGHDQPPANAASAGSPNHCPPAG